jgi:hypothetical protein
MQEVCVSQEACTPPITRAWICVQDSNLNQDTVWFGFESSATCSVDVSVCESSFPWPCGKWVQVFCAFWFFEPCLQVGQDYLLRHNYHKFFSLSQRDTFWIGFQGGPPSSGYPLKFTWSTAQVQTIFDSVIISDLFGGVLYKVRMDQRDSLIVTNSAIDRLSIITYGARLTDIQASDNLLPKVTQLYQNSPNPFNPATTIQFDVPSTGLVSLKIFDVLGREIATLVNEMRPPGSYSVTWNPGNLPSGVYFYRLTAGSYSETKKMILMK